MVACGALVRELRAVTATHDLPLDVHYLPAPLHNRPERIADAVGAAIDEYTTGAHDRVLVGYADCGTGGALDDLVHRVRSEGLAVERLPGDHCYEFFTGPPFADLHGAELGTFFLTDYLARHFDQLIWATFKFDRHPELIPMVFANYTRLVYLAQTDDPEIRAELVALSRSAAERLGLRFELHATGLDPFAESVVELVGSSPRPADGRKDA